MADGLLTKSNRQRLQGLLSPISELGSDYIVDPLNRMIPGSWGDNLEFATTKILPEFSPGMDIRDMMAGSRQIMGQGGDGSFDWRNSLEGLGLMGLGTLGLIPGMDGVRVAGKEALQRMGDARRADVVTNQGRPVIGFHGTADAYDIPDIKQGGRVTEASSAKGTHFLVDDPKVATGYAYHAASRGKVGALVNKATEAEKKGDWDKYDDYLRQAEELDAKLNDNPWQDANIRPSFMKMKNPLEVDGGGKTWKEFEGDLTDRIQEAKRDGYDGVVVNNLDDDVGRNGLPANHYVAFDEKSVVPVYSKEGQAIAAQSNKTDVPLGQRQKNFYDWFRQSKVVDEAGKPLTVYKGMYPHDFNKEVGDYKGPLLESINRGSEFPAFNKGEEGVDIAGFFSSSPETASRFTGEQGAVYPTNLSIKNPFVIDAKGDYAANSQFGESGKPFRDAIRSGEYDGVIIKNTKDEGDVYVALKPEQIKSIHNRGTYNPKDANILKSAAPIAGAGLLAASMNNEQQPQPTGILEY